MNSIDRIVYPPKNIILRMWVVAGLIVAAVFLFVLWDERFRADAETEDVFFGILGIEQGGAIRQSFSGDNFSVRMAKMGLTLAPAHEEAMKKLAEVLFGDEERSGELASVPVIWVYANGRTLEAKDRGYETLGKVFFDPEQFSFSVSDAGGFSIQIDPKILTIFRAKTGEAIGALPLLQRPPNAGQFNFEIAARSAEGQWQKIGITPFNCRLEPTEVFPPSEVPNFPKRSEKAEEEWRALPFIAPADARIRRVQVPRNSLFYSSNLANRDAFGLLEVEITGDDVLPEYAWRVENVALRSTASENPQQALWEEPDAFHSNVRFLEDESFEQQKGALLDTPIAKTLFPRGNEQWRVTAALVRRFGFRQEEIHEFPPLKISKIASTIRFAGTYVCVRAFFEDDYYRLLANNVPALVLEIAGASNWESPGALFWQPYRVQTDTGEEMLPESIVVVRPGVYQYWYMPMKRPTKVYVTYAITHVPIVSETIAPAVKPTQLP